LACPSNLCETEIVRASVHLDGIRVPGRMNAPACRQLGALEGGFPHTMRAGARQVPPTRAHEERSVKA